MRVPPPIIDPFTPNAFGPFFFILCFFLFALFLSTFFCHRLLLLIRSEVLMRYNIFPRASVCQRAGNERSIPSGTVPSRRACGQEAPRGKRKVVVSTNIAETSITIPNRRTSIPPQQINKLDSELLTIL